MSVVQVENVSKIYTRRVSREFLHSLLVSRVRTRRNEGFHALRNVSFRLAEGDSLAVVGPNGAGKSTLLSVIAGLSSPEQGTVRVSGRIAALLELGSGFHNDLTGAENVRLNAALLGLSRKKALERFEAIVEFSGIGEFIDEPLRTYSAGMVMRLAFSVAMNVDPEVLLIDEVLAVGDHAFQVKCIEKILELKRTGKVLICTSHAPETLRQICTTALWLDRGEIVELGSVEQVLAAYAASPGAAHPLKEG